MRETPELFPATCVKDDYSAIHSGTIELYERQSHSWDSERSRTQFVERAWIDRFANLLKDGACVLDVGCGGGYPISTYLSQRGFSMTGIDTSRSLLDLCRVRCPLGEWILMDMRRLRFTADSSGGMLKLRQFDGIIAWDSFFHLNPGEQRVVLRELASQLAPSGVIMMTVGPAAGEVLGTVGGETVYHSSLSPEEYKGLLGEMGVGILEFEKEDPGCGMHTVLLARKQRESKTDATSRGVE